MKYSKYQTKYDMLNIQPCMIHRSLKDNYPTVVLDNIDAIEKISFKSKGVFIKLLISQDAFNLIQ